MTEASPYDAARYPQQEHRTAMRGVVVSGDHLATSAGLEALMAGGNAVDAAISAAAVLTVVEPNMGQLGGDAFMLIYEHARQHVTSINASGPAPLAPGPAAFFRGQLPALGILSSTVPGVVDAWDTAATRYGTLGLARALAPAVRYAAEGFAVTPRLRRELERFRPALAADAASSAIFLRGGEVPAVGDVLVQRDLAMTMQLIGEHGAEIFYRGELARAIDHHSASTGGLLRANDLASFRSDVSEPLMTRYRGHVVYENPLLSPGFALLESLNILEGIPIGSMAPAERIHYLVEASKLAREDLERFGGDPNFVSVPLDELMSTAHAQRRRALINSERALEMVNGGRSPAGTTCLVAADAEQNAVAYIHSLFSGSGVTVPGTGILLNNRIGGFADRPGAANSYAPGKRPIHTLNAFMVLSPNKSLVAGCSPGGYLQIQTNLQLVSQVLDGGTTLQGALDAPRWGIWQASVNAPLLIEDRFDDSVLARLSALGHRVQTVGPWSGLGHHTRAQAVQVDLRSGAKVPATDPRWGGGSVGAL